MRKEKNMPISVALDRLSDFDRRLLELRAAKVPYKEIAAMLDRNERMLTSRMLRLSKLPPTIDEEQARQKEEAGRRSCCTVPRTVDAMTDRDRTMVRMCSNGESFAEIARELDLNRKTVSERLTKMRRSLGTDVVPSLDAVQCKKIRASRPPDPERIPCLVCRRKFSSWCRMRNRICNACKTANQQVSDSAESRVWA